MIINKETAVVITRHNALVQYLVEEGIVSEEGIALPHATPEIVKGKDIIGILPLRLASLAKSITEIPLDLPQELRGKELTIEQVREYAGKPITYNVVAV
jgi:putative CRISPR-associated protein (TIGR02620 family)